MALQCAPFPVRTHTHTFRTHNNTHSFTPTTIAPFHTVAQTAGTLEGLIFEQLLKVFLRSCCVENKGGAEGRSKRRPFFEVLRCYHLLHR